MRYVLLILVLCALLPPVLSGQSARLKDAYPEKARYAPGEAVELEIELEGTPSAGQTVSATITDLAQQVGACGAVELTAKSPARVRLSCSVPAADFHGYLVSAQLSGPGGETLSRRETALDVSSDWKRFPRYGYLAHYNEEEGARPEEWIAELNKFHVDGLQFYDFQFRHDQPLAGTVQQPTARWKDIAGRNIDAAIVRGFIDNAHRHNMMTMAYNASYSAYDDVFTRSTPFPLQWATWTTPSGARTVETAKNLPMHIPGGETSRLYYMNQNSIGWQTYLFAQMNRLFQVYPFDGWHIDTFGDKGGYAYDRSPVDYVAGFKSYINHAHEAIKKRILFNAVNTWGQDTIATSNADFVYSELWEDHETFASILASAEQVRLANPEKAYVVAAYLGRSEAKDATAPHSHNFNPPSVLLTDAAIFASGAAHIELGDGNRMLSNEYFPADTRLKLTDGLRETLRHYYDFLTAYEVYLRDRVTPAEVELSIEGQTVDPLGIPNTVWSIARQHDRMTVVHLINLLGSEDPHWRDVSLKRHDPPVLTNVRVHLVLPKQVQSVGWASPDQEGGTFHSINFDRKAGAEGDHIEVTIPSLRYWDTLFVSTG